MMLRRLTHTTWSQGYRGALISSKQSLVSHSHAYAQQTTPLLSHPSPSPFFRHSTRFQSAYVSRHNISLNVNSQIITEYCQSHGLQLKCSPSHVQIRECPFCVKPTKGQLSNLFKLYVESSTGAYFCHRCGASGSWYDFKARLNGGHYIQSHNHSSSPSSHTQQQGMMGSGSSSGSHYGTSHGQAVPPSTDGHWSPASPEPPLPLPPSRLSSIYSTQLLDQDNDALKYLIEKRGLTRATLRKFGVGRATYKFPAEQGYVDAECITFPWLMKESELQQQEALRGAELTNQSNNSKKKVHKSSTTFSTKNDKEDTNMDTINTEKSTDETTTNTTDKDDPFVTRRIKARAVSQKAWQRLDPPGGGWGLFGWHTIPDDATEIVLTEGEYDAMAVTQATGRHAVSLPNGCRSLPIPVLPLLERFSKIYLWMDNDVPGQEGSETFAKKLGLNRCYIVKCRDAKDANEALLNGLDLDSYIQQATVVPHDRLLTFADLRSEVLHELLEPDLYKGAEVPSLPLFTKLIKGFRRGEMTVLTGPTGSGKTTFLGQVSVDLAEQGMNVLWGSFEIKNTRLLHKLMKQYSRDALPDITLPDAKEKLNALADRFENLPFHFLKFHGGSDIDEVLDAMEYSVYVNDTEHIILDNMQFMISRGNAKNGNWEKFDVQDVAIEKFRKFATQQNIHLTLVVHPRKEDESAKLNISSFYGSAKATQEADTVLILQHDGRQKYVEVKKNRYDGTLGYSPLFFESKSGRYVETQGGSGGKPPSGAPSNPTTSQPPPYWMKEARTEGESDGKAILRDYPQTITFVPPQNRQPFWMKQQKEPESEDLDRHWDEMLTPTGTY